MHCTSLRFGSLPLVLLTGVTIAVYGCTLSAVVPPIPGDPGDPAADAGPAPLPTVITPPPVDTAPVGPIVTPPPPTPPVGPDGGTVVVTNPGGSSGSTPPPPAPPPECTADALQEVEPNDTPATASVLGPPWVICGTVAPGEVDYVSFVAPDDLGSVSYAASWTGYGTPSISLSAGGIVIPAGANPPLVPGATYTFEVVGGAAPVSYVVTVGLGQ